MTDPQIICPSCRTEIRLTEQLAAPLIAETRRKFDQQLAAKEADFGRRESALRKAQDELAQARATVDEQVTAKLKSERAQIAQAEAARARQAVAEEIGNRDRQLSELHEAILTKDAKLAEAQKAQAEMLRKQRELDESKREFELTVVKKVQEGLTAVRDKARLEAEHALKAKVAEKETQIACMQRQIEELRRKAEQGSQQLQGEALEIELESQLRARFSRDLIEPVPKGEFGGDVLHRVVGPAGQACGTILWESKRTKNWSDGWLVKLRDDQRTAKADIAIIVSQILPKGVEAFDLVDGIWVTNTKSVFSLAVALRHSLIEISSARQALEGQQTKTEMVYQYLTGPRFRHRVEAIVEAFSSMQEDLDREKKAITKQWAKREEQIERVMQATAGMYGDLQGIAGKTIQEIEGLELHALNPPVSHPTNGNDQIGS